jgi:hypothetical protein
LFQGALEADATGIVEFDVLWINGEVRIDDGDGVTTIKRVGGRVEVLLGPMEPDRESSPVTSSGIGVGTMVLE